MRPTYTVVILFLMSFGILLVYKLLLSEEDPFKGYEKKFKEDHFNGNVQRLISKRGASLVIFSDEDSIAFGNYRNYQYATIEIHRFLLPGDSIWKRANSDTIWVRRDGQIHFFYGLETAKSFLESPNYK